MAWPEAEPGRDEGFAAIDRHFAGFIAGLSPGAGEALHLAAALVSRAAAAGNVCLDLGLFAGRRLSKDPAGGEPGPLCPPLEAWRRELCASPAVGPPGARRPLILDDRNRLYLYRYWRYEERLIEAVRSRRGLALDAEALETLGRTAPRVFADDGHASADAGQRIAAVNALLRRFCVITGGPGTGKTFAVALILDLLAAWRSERPPRVLLAAPTGKAAARMNESLQARAGRCRTPLPAAATLHRLLGPLPASPSFRRHRGHPLPADLVIVDEASMVDLALMAKLVDALEPSAALVLIGDQDQLASVEAGSVLGDICNRGRHPGFTRETAAALSRVLGSAVPAAGGAAAATADAIVALERSFRFAAQSAIATVSRAVRAGEVRLTLEALAGASAADGLVWIDPEHGRAAFKTLEKTILEGYESTFRAASPEEALKRQTQFRILCAHRAGTFGAEEINRRVEALLLQQGLIRAEERRFFPWYGGRPVLIGRNDYPLGLFNGDLGVCWRPPATGGGEPEVFFPDGRGGVQGFAPYRLPEHETVYALTVHKSQGSEYDHVVLMLPERDSPVLSRELIYTAITRARQRITVVARREVLAAAVARRIERASGLRDALWGGYG